MQHQNLLRHRIFTYHWSRARFVSGQAQQALHLGLSPPAPAAAAFVAVVAAAVSTTPTPFDELLPIVMLYVIYAETGGI